LCARHATSFTGAALGSNTGGKEERKKENENLRNTRLFLYNAIGSQIAYRKISEGRQTLEKSLNEEH